jgi:hypothetical protein
MNEKRFLTITALLVALLGVPAILSVFREPVAVLKPNTTQRSVASVSAAGSGAVVAVEGGRNQIKAKSVTLNLACEGVDADQTIDGTLLRLKYDSCKDEMWKNISVVNTTNGFTASIIDLKKGFTTDFMDLKEGENTLEVVAKTDSGAAIHRTFKVTRMPATVSINN